MSFLTIEIEVDREQLRQNAYDALAARFPGWEPADGNLETWLVAACADLAGDLAEAAVDVPSEIFREFGEKIARVPPIASAAATAATTWTMIDDAGYTIPAGTLVQIALSGSTAIAFEVQSEVQVPAGSTSTDAGEVTIAAAVEGTAANGLAADPTLIDSLAFVASIVLESSPAGGVDEEDPDDYLDRLVEVLRLQSPRPILPQDAAVLARTIGGVYRATAIDLYDPLTDTYDNEKTVTVAVAGEDGLALAAPIKTAVEELLEAEREINFVFHVIDPNYTEVDISVEGVAASGYATTDVEGWIATALAALVSPTGWGIPLEDPRGWTDLGTLRRNELIRVVGNVQGLAYIETLTLALGGGVLGTADVALDAPASLPTLGDVTITVT